MFKRLFWFTSGAATGAAGSFWVRRRIQEKLRRYTPGGVKDQAVAKARQATADARTMVNEGRALARKNRAEQAGQSARASQPTAAPTRPRPRGTA